MSFVDSYPNFSIPAGTVITFILIYYTIIMKSQSTLLKFKNDQLHDLSSIRGGQIVKQAILDLIIVNAQHQVKKSNGAYKQFTNLLEPLNKWKHGHYRNLACMLDIPTNTLKYYIHEGTSLKSNNRKKILQFLGYAQQEWDRFEDEAVISLLGKKLRE